jgi:hypothetical protein
MVVRVEGQLEDWRPREARFRRRNRTQLAAPGLEGKACNDRKYGGGGRTRTYELRIMRCTFRGAATWFNHLQSDQVS